MQQNNNFQIRALLHTWSISIFMALFFLAPQTLRAQGVSMQAKKPVFPTV